MSNSSIYTWCFLVRSWWKKYCLAPHVTEQILATSVTKQFEYGALSLEHTLEHI